MTPSVFWDLSTGELLQACKTNGDVNAVVFAPDGKTVASASSDDLVSFWDVATGQLLKTLEHDASVISVAYAPDGKTVASASEDGKIQFWDIASSKRLNIITGHGLHVFSLTYSPDGNTLVSGNVSKIDFWNLETGEHLKTISVQPEHFPFGKRPFGSVLTGWQHSRQWQF